MKRGLLYLLFAGSALAAPSNILNVSYDVTREFYQEYNLPLRWPTRKKMAWRPRWIFRMADRANKLAP